ncbi:hypothetical protein F3059_13585 [Salibacter halophilus]|uniref:Type VI secretion system effector TseH-like domain-containing protein n=1 Tax=Salibacter halophilus TaxID=1803916 RepID=A0A6N6M4I0_9FLAO|nr:hypothetical protein F3059_13585 [Salibacter halophilus]
MKGSGNSLDFGARIYDPRIGKFLSLDPLMKKYPAQGPYNFVFNSPIAFKDADGRDGILVVFPDYKISTPLGKVSGLGHAGVLLIDNKTGLTKYYEYGRYDKEGKGIVRQVTVPNVVMGDNGKPTQESLNKVMSAISKKSGHGGRIEGAYIESDKFKEMNDYAQKKKAENTDPDREPYDLTDNNCGTFGCDVLDQDEDVEDDAPWIADPRPNSIVGEYQDEFPAVNYDPEKNETSVDGMYESEKKDDSGSGN